MPLSKQEWLALEKKAHELRLLTLDTTKWAGSGHIGGGMSALDVMTVLYHKYMKIDVKNPKWEDRDRFILSKGHVGVAYAPLLCDLGFNDKELLKTFNLSNSTMGIHLDSNKVVGVDASTGSLGHGILQQELQVRISRLMFSSVTVNVTRVQTGKLQCLLLITRQQT